jgi:hypothetical protein
MVFRDLPILRVRFCGGLTKSLFPAELWRGRATVSSVLEAVHDAAVAGIGSALQWAMQAGDGDEPVSDRSLRRWAKRTAARVPLASAQLGFPAQVPGSTAAKLDDFMMRLRPQHLLQLRRQWGYGLLDAASLPPSRPRTATWPRPGGQDPAVAHDPPSRYLPRGTRSRLARRGRPPDA